MSSLLFSVLKVEIIFKIRLEGRMESKKKKRRIEIWVVLGQDEEVFPLLPSLTISSDSLFGDSSSRD